MSGIAAQPDRRFRRSHVKPSRTRRRWSRALFLLRYVPAVLLVGFGLQRTWKAVVSAEVLGIDRIVVRGTERLSEGDVLDVLGSVRGESLVWADLDGWREQLLMTPWVKDAFLRRALPSTLEVEIWERHPIGIARMKSTMYLVDESATIIDRMTPRYADLDLPIIDGLDGPDPKTVAVDPARTALAASVISAFKANPDVGRRLSQVNVADLHNAKVILTGDPAVIYLGADRFLERLQSYLELAPVLREQVDHIDYVDVRFDSRVYVKPASNRVREHGTGG